MGDKEVTSYFLKYPNGTLKELGVDKSLHTVGLKPGERYYIVTNRYGRMLRTEHVPS